MALSKAFIGSSAAQRTQSNLAEEEQRLRARIAATTDKGQSAETHRLYSARVYLDGAKKRHDTALQDYRAAQEQLAAAPEPRRSVVDRLLGRQPAIDNVEALTHRVDSARANLIDAEHFIRAAEVNLARIEKAEAGERRRLMGEMEIERRSALELLGEVLMAQQIVRAFPTIIYTGPSFVRWAGGKIERKRRRGQRNPFATNIWGLPVDPGY